MASNKTSYNVSNCHKGTLTFYYTIKEAICEKVDKFVKVDIKHQDLQSNKLQLVSNSDTTCWY